MEVIIALIGFVFSTIGVKFIFDARQLTKKFFSFQDVNEGTEILKIFGIIITILGMLIVYFYLRSAIIMLK